MISDAPTQRNKTWEELASAASKETDPDEVATIAEEIFAALEERERTSPTLTENSKLS
jgi:mannitol/fructose-specific phosphotransferase system IIA component (Ntr-type)